MARHANLVREQAFQHANTVTSSSETVLEPTDALWIGATGSLQVKMLDGSIVTFVGVPAGELLPISVTQVLPAGTANSVIALYDH